MVLPTISTTRSTTRGPSHKPRSKNRENTDLTKAFRPSRAPLFLGIATRSSLARWRFRQLRLAIEKCARSSAGMTNPGTRLDSGRVAAPAEFRKRAEQASQRKADYVEVAAFDAWDMTPGATLDGVGAGFVIWLVGREVGG